MPNPFDQFDAVPQANPFDKFDEATAPLQSSGLRRAVADPAISLARGVIGVPEAIVGLADIPTLGGAGKAAEALGFRPREAKEFLGEFYSPEYKQTQQELQEAQGFFPTIQKAIEKPSIIAHGLIESLPSIGAGGAVARGVLAAAPRLGFAGAGAVGEGAVSAGATAEQIRQQTETGLLTPGQSATAAISGAATGGVTVAGAKIAQRFGLLDVEQILAGRTIEQATGKGAIRRVAEGFATEGAEELLQSSQEQIAQNIALGEELGMGVGQAAALGMLTGGLLGGGMQLARGQKPTQKGEPTVEPIADLPVTEAPAVPEPMGLSEFIRANREEGVTGPITAAEVKAARPEYEAYKQAFIDEQFGTQPLTPEQRNPIIINQTPTEVPAPTPVEAAPEPVQKTRIAEPAIIGEQPAPAPAAPIITAKEAELLRIAEKETGYAPDQVEVQRGVQRQRGEGAARGQTPAAGTGDRVLGATQGEEGRAQSVETKVALLKRQRGELLTNREEKLVRDYEKAAPAIETPAVQTQPRFRGRQFGSAERRENFVNAYSSAVDTTLADLTAQGVVVTPNKLRRAASLLKRSAEAAVTAKDDAAGATILDGAMGKALRGIIPKAEIEVFRQKLADATQAALPETLSSRAAVDEAIVAKADEIRNVIAGMVGTPKGLVVEAAPRVAGGAGMIQFGELRDMITVSLQASDAGSVAAHEGFHYLDKRVLTGPERRIVRQAFASGSRLHRMLVTKAEAYDAANGTDITSEIRAIPAEARAYGFEFWRRGELEAQGMIAKVFQKLARVMERIRNYIDGLGFTSYEDLFAMIRRGEYAQRDLSGIREFEREVMRSRAQRETSEKAFYSALAEAVADIRKVAGKDGMIAPAQAKTWLAARQKEGRFKAAELEAVGLAEWLDLQPGKVSVDDIETFVREHGVQVEETVLGVTYEQKPGVLRTSPTKFHEYQLPGGENYRELLLSLPRTAKKQYRFQVFGAFPMDFATREAAEQYMAYIQAQPELHANLAKYPPSIEPVETDASRAKEFRSSHFPDQPNILAHIRFNERTDAAGKRVLFLEELQSDWAQEGRKEGRKEGFAGQQAATVDSIVANAVREGREVTSAEREQIDDIMRTGRGSGGAIPNAPFVTDTKAWVALALKRMIRYAAENGFDRVAWTTGEQQAARYDLSKHVDSLDYFVEDSGDWRLIGVKGGQQVIDRTVKDRKGLDELVGKEVAEKIVMGTGESHKVNGVAFKSLSGLDLKVGGEGMKAFYDRIVPQVANELLKKFGGGKVGEAQLAKVSTKQGNYIERGNGGYEVFYADGTSYGVYPTREGAGVALAKIERTHPSPAPSAEPTTSQPGFDITPALRGEAMAGLPLFSKAATESIQDIGRRFAEGDLQREQVNAYLAGQLDRPDMRDLSERLIEKAGVEVKTLGNSLRRIYHGYVGSGLNRARASQGYANVFGVMTHFIQRKAIIFERAIAKDLSTWVKGATKQDKVAVSKAMLEATVRGLARDSAEYHSLMQPLTQDQRAMADQAWTMIGKMLDAEFVAEQAKYRKLFSDDAKFNEWFENRKVQVEQLKRNSYFPERRYGDHFVHAYVEAPDGKKITVYYEQYEREAGALEAKAELDKIFAAEGLKVDYGFKHKVEYDGSISIGQFLDLAQRHGIALTQVEKERLGKALIAADSTRRNRLFRRQNVAGYSQDGMRVLAEFAVSMSNKIAYSEMGDALQDALQGRQVDVAFTKEGTVAINTQADTDLWKLDGPDAGFFRNLADEKVGFVMSPESRSTVSNKLRALAVIYFLGGSIAAAGVNLSSLPMITLPWLTQHANPAKASATLLEGMRLAGKHFNDIRDLPTLLGTKPLEGVDNVEGLRHALQIAAQDGSLFDTEIYQFMGLSRGQEYSLSGRTQEAVKLWMTPFRLAEQYNRVSAYIAAYKVAKSNNLDNEAAAQQAQEAVYGTQFRYDEANRPALADSGVGSLFFVFKSFPIFMMETMTFLAKTNPKSAVFMLGMLVLMAGVEGLPFAEDLEDLIDVLAQRLFGEPFNSKRWLRNTLKNASEAVVGADLSGVLMHGVANTLTGLNFASRVGAGNLIPGTRVGAADSDYRRAMDEILGPVGGMVSGMVEGADALSKGDFMEAAKKGLPLAAKNAVKGWEQFEKGYATDAGGRKLVDVGSWEAFWQSLGFSSSALSQVYESDTIDRRTVAFYNGIKTQFTKEMVAAIRDGDREVANEVGQAVMAWNQAHPDMPIAMSPAGLRRQVALAGMPLNQRTLLTMPKYLRGQSEAAIGLAAE